MNIYIFIIFLTCFRSQHGQFTNNIIDMEDILSEDCMPSTLLMLENIQSANGAKKFNQSKELKKFDGSFHTAMDTMNFHRGMMNQYLCRSYVAEQIINDMSVTRVKRRMGHVPPGVEHSGTNRPKFPAAVKNTLLTDEGSSGYQDWLSKSTTLEDIYRHYGKSENKIDDDVIIDDEEKTEDFEEDSEPSSYSAQKSVTKTNLKNRGEEIYYSGGGGYQYHNPYYQHAGDSGYSHGNSYGYSVHEPQEHSYDHGQSVHDEPVYHSSPPKYHEVHSDEQYSTKEKDLTQLFEIALTALAFLSFGMFIVHVIMCISAVTNNPATAEVLMPMSMSPTATATGGGTGSGTMTGTGGGNNTGITTPPTTTTTVSTGGGTTGTGAGTTGTGSGNTGTGGGTTGTGGGGGTTGTGGGTTGTGTGGGTTATGMGGGGTTSTANGGGTTATGGGTTGTGGGTTGAGGGTTGTGSGATGAGGGTNSTGNGGATTGTATGGGGTTSTATGGGTPGTSTGGGTTNTGGGTTGGGTGTGGDNTNTGAGTTGGGTTGTVGGTTGGVSPGGATLTGSGTSTATVGGGGNSGSDTFKFRFRRDIPTITNPNTQALNEMARRILISIEGALVANSDEGVCLRKSLCENNKWSRSLEGRNRFVVPLLSLGMSWLSGKIVKSSPPFSSMLDTLKASILGLGNANCEIIYQKCDLPREREMRRKRRRKRSVR